MSPRRHPSWCTQDDCGGHHLGERTAISPTPGGRTIGVRLSQPPGRPVGVGLREINHVLHERPTPRAVVTELGAGEARALAVLLVELAGHADRLNGRAR